MAANPLTYLEMEAYERKRRVHLTAWQAGLIMRLDDAVLASVQARPDEPSSQQPAPPNGDVHVSDVKGLKALFSGIAARRRK